MKELRTLATKFSPAQFRDQMGPFVLVQQPPNAGAQTPSTQAMGLPINVQRTTVAKPEKVSAGALALLFQFDELVVAQVPPLQGVDQLSVGRQPDNDLVLDDPSVSKKHAILRWDAENSRCTVQDLGSTNGTFLNASVRIRRETTLKNGDILSFGEVQYWFLLTDTLHEKLKSSSRGFGV
ncbi:MAG: FHA domain-containing protein [Myxococcaceae bacterium]